jgi:tetratricopeptide (TPR) repeat protein
MFRKLFVIFCLLGATVVLSACSSKNTERSEYYNEGIALLEAGKYSEALVSFKKAINENPSDTDSYLQAAEILIDKNQYEEAINILKNGIGFSEFDQKLFTKLGEVNFLKGDLSEALSNFNKAISIDNDNEAAVIGKITTLSHQQNTAELKSFVSKRIGKAESDEIQMLKGFILYENVDDALKVLNDVKDKNDKITNAIGIFDEIKASGYSTVLEMKLAREIINSGYGTLAIPIAEKTISENEFYEGGYLYKGIGFFLLGNLEEAENLLREAVRYNSSLSEGFLYLALVQAAASDTESANMNFQFALNFADNEMKKNILRRLIDYLYDERDISGLVQRAAELGILDPTTENKKELATYYCVSSDANISNTISELKASNETDLSEFEACSSLLAGDNENAKNLINSLYSSDPTNPFVYFLGFKVAQAESDSVAVEELKMRILDVDKNGFYSEVLGIL